MKKDYLSTFRESYAISHSCLLYLNIPLLEARSIQFSINMQAEEDMKPSMELKRNIYLIFKEAIFNIVRHSGSTKVEIDVLFGSRTFEMKIADNGKGFDRNIKT